MDDMRAVATRRQVLLGVAAGAAVIGLGRPVAAQPPAMPFIRPRSDWADQPPRGPLEAEAPGDVRFLLVHHTASGNGYSPEDVVGQLRGFFRFHTGDRGWNDIAYNFLIDRFGTIWEGRQGSIEQPIKGDATGGSQGFAVLASFIGDLEAAPPTPEAQAAMIDLLAWQASRYAIDPRATTTFTSRGSNLHPAGTPVTTRTIAGHRDMSATTCPGQHGYALVGELPDLLAARMTAAATAQAEPVQPDPPPSQAPPPVPTEPPAVVPQPDALDDVAAVLPVDPLEANGLLAPDGTPSMPLPAPLPAKPALGLLPKALGSPDRRAPMTISGLILAATAAGVGAVLHRRSTGMSSSGGRPVHRRRG